MKFTCSLISLSLSLSCCVAFAQPPGGPGGRGGQGFGGQGQRGQGLGGPGGQGRGGQGPGGQGFGGPGGQRQAPPNPLALALDLDGDQTLSAEELKKAPLLLKKFDLNKDGRISEDEMRPQPPEFGQLSDRQSRDGASGRPGGERGREETGQRGGPEGRGPGGPEGRGPGGPEGRGQGGNTMQVHPERMQAHAMEFDKDKDGLLSADELKAFIADFAKVHGGDTSEQGRGRGDRGRGNNQAGNGGQGEASGRPSRPR